MMNFEKFDARIIHPFTLIVSGGSGVGKSEWVLQLLDKRDNLLNTSIEYILWCYGQQTKRLQYISEKYKDKVTLIEGIPDNFETYINSSRAGLVVFDDLMQEAVSSKVMSELFTKQSHHLNLSVVLVLQNIYAEGKVRKTLYRNAHYLVLFKTPLDYSIVYSLAQKINPKKSQRFLNMFKRATSEPYGYLFIDGKAHTPDKIRFRYDIFHPLFQRVLEPLDNL